MAVIGTIRNRLGFVLVGFVGFALVVFVLEGLFSSNKSAFGGGANDVAKVAGESVSIQDFEQRIQQSENLYKQQNRVESIDAGTSDQIREQAWNQMLSEMILNKEYDKLGLTVSAEELFDMVQGKNVDPQVRQAFTDPKTGVFDPSRVMGFLKNLESADEAQRTQWLNFEKNLQEQRLSQKYAVLISQGLYVTKNEAKFDFEAQNKVAKIRYVLNNYSTVPDNSVKVEQADLESSYKEHQKEYNQEETTRRIEYVTFDVVPSAEDTKEVKENIQKDYENFKNAKDDSAYVAVNSDGKFDLNYYKKGMLAPKLDSLMFNNAVGFVYGPYLDGDKYKIAKLNDVKLLPDSVKARHILLSIANANDPAEKAKVLAKADSIKKAIKGGAKFADMALKFSKDGSSTKGGDLGWFGDATMVKPFSNACFEGKKGDMPIVVTQFGVHIIEILDQAKTSKKVRVAFLERKLSPSNKTYQTLFGNATQFASSVTGADFEKTASSKGLTKLTADVKESDRTVSGLESSRSVIQWAYKAEKGESS
jgi:peptidyl-prolyl cis-trans isomerase D